MRYVVLVVLSGVSLLGAAARIGAEGRGTTRPPAVYEQKDAEGRLLFRIVFRPDGALNHTAYTYARGAARTGHEAELDQGTDPRMADTDRDGTSDGADCYPLDASRSACGTPNPSDTTAPTITLDEPPGAVPVP